MSLSVQFLSLLAMIGTGIVAGAILDWIGISVESTKKGSFFRKHSMVIEAFAWLIIGCGAFYVLFLVRDGAWRMYDPFAQISGMLLYSALFYKPFRILGHLVKVIVFRPIWYVICLIGYVIRFIIRIIWRLFHIFSKPFLLLGRGIRTKTTKKQKNDV